MNWNSRRISAILSNALMEDQATRDVTTLATIEPHQRATATIVAKEDCVLAGLGSIQRVFELFAELEGEAHAYSEVTSSKEIFDGVSLHKGQAIASIWHNARALLSCERLILNLLQRLSGIATITAKYVAAIDGTGAAILDTRKTAPGLRLLEKYAVRCGGGFNHRIDLSDGILVKNNHIDIAGSVQVAVERVMANRKGGQMVEVEVRNMQELDSALQYGAESILLDNMTVAQTREAVARIRQEARPMRIESSGGTLVIPISFQNSRNAADMRSASSCAWRFCAAGALDHLDAVFVGAGEEIESARREPVKIRQHIRRRGGVRRTQVRLAVGIIDWRGDVEGLAHARRRLSAETAIGSREPPAFLGLPLKWQARWEREYRTAFIDAQIRYSSLHHVDQNHQPGDRRDNRRISPAFATADRADSARGDGGIRAVEQSPQSARRAQPMKRLAVILRGRRDQLADLMTAEVGKPIAASEAEVENAPAAATFSPKTPRVFSPSGHSLRSAATCVSIRWVRCWRSCRGISRSGRSFASPPPR